MANPVITNVAVISRFAHLAAASECVIDGAEIAADGYIKRGVVLVKKVNGKWKPFAAGDTLVHGETRIMQDDLKVVAGQDGFCAAYFQGFFKKSSVLAFNAGMLAADLTAAAGFLAIESDEVRLW